MIYLITGLPGAGKTLYALSFVQKEFGTRNIYFDGIADLKLPWIPLEGGGKEWGTVPDGSVIVIDESQRVFRMRGVGSGVPGHVAALETHRHRGIDIVLITQHPKLIDSHVRRLVGNHRHVVRAFGTKTAIVMRWDEIKDDPDKSREDALRETWAYPREMFSAYKSAEVHTHKRSIPFRFFLVFGLPLLAVACIGGGVWFVMDRYGGGEAKMAAAMGKSSLTKAGEASGGGMGSGAAKQDWRTRRTEYLEAYAPRIAGLAMTAEAYADVAKPRQMPEPAACVEGGERCTCYTQQATRLADVPLDLCREIVANGYFRAWEEPRRAEIASSIQSRSAVGEQAARGPSASLQPERVSAPVAVADTGPADPRRRAPVNARTPGAQGGTVSSAGRAR